MCAGEGGRLAATEPTIRCPQDAASLLSRYLADADREHSVVLLLNARSPVIGINTVSIGSLSEAIVHPRQVFKPAVLLGCAAIILGHNHPSGAIDPSSEDVQIANRMVEAGKLLGIEVLDHVIVAEGGRFASLKERGLLG